MIRSVKTPLRENFDRKPLPAKETLGKTKATGRRALGKLALSFLPWVLIVSGCASLHKKGPVAENVVACRNFSQQAVQAMQQGDWHRSESLLSKAIEACPVDERARRDYAKVLWHRGARPEAILQMEQALQLGGDDPEALVSLGEMYLSVGNRQQAQKQATRAIELKVSPASAWALRGDVYRHDAKPAQALACYLRGLSYQPNDSHVQYEVAEIYREQNRPQRALATLEKMSAQFAPGRQPVRILFLRGLAYKALHRYDDCIEALAEARSREPENIELLYHLGQAEFLAGNQVNGRLTIQQALRLAPEHPGCRQLLAQINTAQQSGAAFRR